MLLFNVLLCLHIFPCIRFFQIPIQIPNKYTAVSHGQTISYLDILYSDYQTVKWDFSWTSVVVHTDGDVKQTSVPFHVSHSGFAFICLCGNIINLLHELLAVIAPLVLKFVGQSYQFYDFIYTYKQFLVNNNNLLMLKHLF